MERKIWNRDGDMLKCVDKTILLQEQRDTKIGSPDIMQSRMFADIYVYISVKLSRTLKNSNVLLVIAKRTQIVEPQGQKRGAKDLQWLEAGKSQSVTLCDILVFDGSLCYLISKVSVCVKVLLPL